MDRLPTLRRLDQTPGGRFLSLLDGEPVGAQRPVATSSRGLPHPVLRGTPPFRVSPQPQRPIMPLEQAAMAQSMARPRTSTPMTKLQQDLAMKMGLTGAAQQQPQQPSGIMGQLPGVGTPGFSGLSAAAARGLQLSGYQDRPITTGQVLGEMMGAGMKAYQEQKRSDLADRIALAKLAQPGEFEKKLALAGIDPNTAEGQELIQKMLTKPGTAITMGGGKEAELLFKSALEDRKTFRQESKVDPKIEARLDQFIALLEKGVRTGKFEALTLPFKKLGVGMGLIGEAEAETISEQEVLQSIGDQMAPLMRVAGSGSSSDKDVELFQSATASMDKTPYANLIIAKTIKQTNRNNKKRLALLDQYIKENKTTLGFDEYAYEAVGPIFHRAGSNEELQGLLDAGKVQTGDVYYDEEFNKFMFVEVE